MHLESSRRLRHERVLFEGEGGLGLSLWKTDLELGIGGRPGHVPTFLGWFWVHACNTAHV